MAKQRTAHAYELELRKMIENRTGAKMEGNRYRIDEYDGNEEVYEPEDENYITIE